jgi:hypothetical protein
MTGVVLETDELEGVEKLELEVEKRLEQVLHRRWEELEMQLRMYSTKMLHKEQLEMFAMSALRAGLTMQKPAKQEGRKETGEGGVEEGSVEKSQDAEQVGEEQQDEEQQRQAPKEHQLVQEQEGAVFGATTVCGVAASTTTHGAATGSLYVCATEAEFKERLLCFVVGSIKRKEALLLHLQRTPDDGQLNDAVQCYETGFLLMFQAVLAAGTAAEKRAANARAAEEDEMGTGKEGKLRPRAEANFAHIPPPPLCGQDGVEGVRGDGVIEEEQLLLLPHQDPFLLAGAKALGISAGTAGVGAGLLLGAGVSAGAAAGAGAGAVAAAEMAGAAVMAAAATGAEVGAAGAIGSMAFALLPVAAAGIGIAAVASAAGVGPDVASYASYLGGASASSEKRALAIRSAAADEYERKLAREVCDRLASIWFEMGLADKLAARVLAHALQLLGSYQQQLQHAVRAHVRAASTRWRQAAKTHSAAMYHLAALEQLRSELNAGGEQQRLRRE